MPARALTGLEPASTRYVYSERGEPYLRVERVALVKG